MSEITGSSSAGAGADDACVGMALPSVSFREAFWLWVKVALNSFGGPVGQIAVMHRYLVEEKRWISEGRFLHALNYRMLLPGPEAQQLATFRLKLSLLKTIAISAGLGAAYHLALLART